MSKSWVTILAAVSVLLAAACAPSAPPPPPAEARPLAGSGAHEQRLDDVTRELRDALEARHGRLEVKAYRLPPETAWSDVTAHYRNVLSGWDAEPALPERIRAGHARAWKRYSALVAIALIDTPVAGQKRDYTMLVVAVKSRGT
ncbi:hypothetical protein EI613_29220 [Azospirillum sp. 412522]|nr:hypothetical protein [Azospirillum sp. 412522]MBY6265965.1 hypothetical protein [Azospirillum sp. 412522]